MGPGELGEQPLQSLLPSPQPPGDPSPASAACLGPAALAAPGTRACPGLRAGAWLKVGKGQMPCMGMGGSSADCCCPLPPAGASRLPRAPGDLGEWVFYPCLYPSAPQGQQLARVRLFLMAMKPSLSELPGSPHPEPSLCSGHRADAPHEETEGMKCPVPRF